LELNLLILNNADPFIHSAHVRDVVVSTVGNLSPLELKGSELAFTVGYYPYTQTAVLVSNTNKPSRVEADSRQINEITDLNTVESGWKYLPDSRQLIIKLNHASNRTGVKVRL
jgi:hypothetical protein